MASRVLAPPRRRGATRPAVLIIEDDRPVADVIAEALRRQDYECLVTEVAEDALQMLMHMSFDLAVIDIFMRGQGGLAAIQALRQRIPGCKIIATSGGWGSMTSTEALRAAYKMGAHETLPKPFRLDQLTALAARLLAQQD
jgi:DNA-binding NtrC family response regulator